MCRHEFYFDRPSEVTAKFSNNANICKMSSVIGLKFLYINIVSLRHKLNELQTYLLLQNVAPDIILLTETRLHTNESKYFNIPGYTSFHSCRETNKYKKTGGGVAVFITTKINANLSIEYKNNFDNMLLINLISKNINIGLVYSPPDAPKDNLIDTLEANLSNTPTIFFGDFNLDLRNLNTTTQLYLDTIIASNYYIINKISSEFPTRIARNKHKQSATIIDHILCNIPNLKYHLNYIDHYLSDHKILSLQTDFPLHQNSTIKKTIIIKQIKYNLIQNYLNSNPITLLPKEVLNDKLDKFVNDLQVVIQKYTSYTTNNDKIYKQPWMKKDLYCLINNKTKVLSI